MLRAAESPKPCAARGRGRRQDQLSGKARSGRGRCAVDVNDQARVRHVDTRLPVNVDTGRDRAVQINGPVDPGRQFRQHTLRLAQRVAVQNGGLASGGAQVAPLDDVARHLGRVGPAVDGQAKGGFGDEGVARHHFKGAASGIGLALVVARHHPDLPIGFDANLRRTEHVAGRVQRDPGVAQREDISVAVNAVVLVAQAPLQDGQPFGAGVIAAHAHASVVAMAVGEHGGGNRPPGVDVELAGRAIQAFRPPLHDVGH
ncbi:hypothetical protein D3C73_853390 [compost metagenome]